jgi:hypothetical protein
MSKKLQTRFCLVAALAVCVAAAIASGAFAFYTGHSAGGTATGQISSLPAPTLAAPTPGTGTVALSWSAVTAPGSGSVRYYVRRDGGEPAGTCPTSSSAEAVTSCTDSGLGAGNHVYTVTAVWRSWSARSAEKTANVTTGVADHLVLSAQTGSPTAGVTDNLTITAKDSAGNTVSTYSGTKSLTFGGATSAGSTHPTVVNSSGSAVAFGTAENITFNGGIATVSSGRNGVMTLYRAETALITVTDGTLTNGSGTSVTVGPAGTSAFALSTPSPTAGRSFEETITAIDQYGNTTPSYTGTKTSMTFSGPEKTSPNGKTASYPTSVLFSSGVGTATITLVVAQTTTLTAKQSFTTTGTSASFTVAAGSASALSVGTIGTQTAGKEFTVTIAAIDADGNTQPAYEGAKALTFSEPDPSPSGKLPAYPETVSFANGKGTAAMTLYDAETTPLKVSDGTLTGTSSNFVVNGAAAPVGYTLSTPATQIAGKSFEETITAKDTYGNNAAYSGTKTIAWSGPESSPKGEAPKYTTSVSFSSGTSTNVSITLYKAATTTLTAKENTAGLSGTSASFGVSAASASVFAWGPVANQTAGSAFNVTLTADDAYGNLAVYEGTKTITFTGPETSPGGEKPAYPATVSFTAGVGSASVKLYDATTSVAITATQSAVKGTSSSFAVSPLSATALTLATPASQTAGTQFSETISAVDTYGNVATGFEGTQPFTFGGFASSPSGKAPVYPASVSFTAGQGSAQITLYSAEKQVLTATTGAISGATAAFTVNPAATTAFALSTPAPTAGTAFTETLTAKDSFGNTTTAYSGTKTIAFSGPGNSPKGEAPKYTTSVSFTSGASTNASITIYNAASTTLTAKEGTIAGTSASFTVLPASASVFSIASPGTQTAGTAFSLTLTATDAFGNTPVYEGSQKITFKGPETSPNETAPVYPATVSFTNAKGTATGVTLYDATTSTTIEASQTSGPKGTSAAFAVNPTTATKTAWSSPGSSTGEAEGLCLFTCVWGSFTKNREWSSKVSVTDNYGNVVSAVGSGHNVTLAMTENASTGKLSTKSLTMPTTGTATTSSSVTYTSPNSNTWSSDSFTAQAAGFSSASATVKR